VVSPSAAAEFTAGRAPDDPRADRTSTEFDPYYVSIPFFHHHALDNAFALQPLMTLDWEENLSDAIFTPRRKWKAKFCGFASEEFVGDLDEKPCAIAGLRIASTCAAVSQVDKNLDAFEDDVV